MKHSKTDQLRPDCRRGKSSSMSLQLLENLPGSQCNTRIWFSCILTAVGVGDPLLSESTKLLGILLGSKCNTRKWFSCILTAVGVRAPLPSESTIIGNSTGVKMKYTNTVQLCSDCQRGKSSASKCQHKRKAIVVMVTRLLVYIECSVTW